MKTKYIFIILFSLVFFSKKASALCGVSIFCLQKNDTVCMYNTLHIKYFIENATKISLFVRVNGVNKKTYILPINDTIFSFPDSSFGNGESGIKRVTFGMQILRNGGCSSPHNVNIQDTLWSRWNWINQGKLTSNYAACYGSGYNILNLQTPTSFFKADSVFKYRWEYLVATTGISYTLPDTTANLFNQMNSVTQSASYYYKRYAYPATCGTVSINFATDTIVLMQKVAGSMSRLHRDTLLVSNIEAQCTYQIKTSTGSTYWNYSHSSTTMNVQFNNVANDTYHLVANWTSVLLNCPVYRDTLVVYVPPATSLPVELFSFTVSKTAKGNELKWSTASEKNSSYFEIQFSKDGKFFDSIGIVTSHGESQIIRDYAFLHNLTEPGIVYYRLKMVDKDNTHEYSKVLAIKREPEELEIWYPFDLSGKNPTDPLFWYNQYGDKRVIVK